MSFMFTGLAADIAAIIGDEATERLLRARGGTQVTIPRRSEGSMLADMIGDIDAERLIRAFGHGKITLPCGPSRGVAARRRRAKKMLRGGASLQEVALACDLHMRTVSNYRADLDASNDPAQFELPFDKPASDLQG